MVPVVRPDEAFNKDNQQCRVKAGLMLVPIEVRASIDGQDTLSKYSSGGFYTKPPCINWANWREIYLDVVVSKAPQVPGNTPRKLVGRWQGETIVRQQEEIVEGNETARKLFGKWLRRLWYQLSIQQVRSPWTELRKVIKGLAGVCKIL